MLLNTNGISSVTCDASIRASLCYEMYKQVKLFQAILVIISENKEQNMGNHQNAECETSCSPVRHPELRNPHDFPMKKMKKTAVTGSP